MTVLRLLLHRASDAQGFPWALLAEDGSLLATGDPGAAYPAATRCELILPAAQCAFVPVTLPVATRRPNALQLGAALEEGLLNDPLENGYRLLARNQPGRAAVVCLTDLAWLRGVRADLAARVAPVTHVLPEVLLLPLPAVGEWTLAWSPQGWLVRVSACQALCVPLVGEDLWPALRQQAPVSTLRRCGDNALPAALQDLPLQTLPAYDWRTAPRRPGPNFAPPRWDRHWLHWQVRRLARPAATLLLGLMVLDLLLLAGMRAWFGWQSLQLTAQMQAQARSMGLARQSVAALLPQAREKVAVARQQRGLTAATDLLPMLVDLQPLLPSGVSLRQLRYQPGELWLDGVDVTVASLRRWQPRLQAQGWQLAAPAPQQLRLWAAEGA